MARKLKASNIDSKSARTKLKPRAEPYWSQVERGKVHLGYRRLKEGAGSWTVRHYTGNQQYEWERIGIADDFSDADGVAILNFDQAVLAARARMVVRTNPSTGESKKPLTVREAMARYIDLLAAQGKQTVETEARAAIFILPELGDLEVAELTSARIRKWLAATAARPALLRSKKGAEKRNTKPLPGDDPEAIRRRRSSANRILTSLKAALNHAHDDDKLRVTNAEAWGREVKPFRNVEAARTRYLTIAEAKRLLNACAPDFREMVQAALETGCRYAELCRLQVHDFNPDVGTVHIRKSKSGDARHVILSDEGTAFFAQLTAGRRGDELMLQNRGRVERALELGRKRLLKLGMSPADAMLADKGEWRPSEQTAPMKEACERAHIEPRISIHGLRHTWASLSVMAGMPLMVVAKNLGHKNTHMVEKHYGHLAPSYVVDAIRAGAPKFGFKPDEKIATLKLR